MKKKITMVMAGLGICAAVMFVNLSEANAIDCTNSCKWDGSDPIEPCVSATQGCWCGSECEA